MTNEPNLLGLNPFANNPNPSVLETLYGEENLRRIDDAFRHTGSRTTLKAVARFNNPSLDDRISFINPATIATKRVLSYPRLPPTGDFPFGYNPPTLDSGLIPLADSGVIFELLAGSHNSSRAARNGMGLDKLVTFEIIGNVGHPNNQIGSLVLGWELFFDFDYQDGVYELSGAVPVPEPGSAGLCIALVMAGRGLRRVLRQESR